MSTRKCSKCGEVKEITEFRENGKYYLWLCKKCQSKYQKIMYIQNRAETTKIYQKTDMNLTLKGLKQCRECRVIKPIKEYYKLKPANSSYQSYCKKCTTRKSREYYKRNKDKIEQRNYKYSNKKYLTDTNYKLARLLRNRCNHVLQDKNKSLSTVKLLGCSIDNFKKHIEKQFTNNMSWDNHSIYGWHIDHIRPCASFDLTDPEQQKQCFHYTNLQPLWAKENLSKGAKI